MVKAISLETSLQLNYMIVRYAMSTRLPNADFILLQKHFFFFFFLKSVCLQKELNINAGTLHLILCVLANRIKVVIVAFQAQTQIQTTYIWILQAKLILVRFLHKTNLFNLSRVIFPEFSIKISKMSPQIILLA